MVPFFTQAQSGAASAQTAQQPEVKKHVLAPGDRIMIRVSQASKINRRTFQILPDGSVAITSVGRIQAAGKDTSALEQAIATRMKPAPNGEPKVSVTVVSYSATRNAH